MSTMKPGADRNRRVLSVLGVAGMLIAMGVGVYVFRGCSSSDVESTANPTAKSAAAKDSVPAIEIPKFSRPEEAARYFDAVIEGDRITRFQAGNGGSRSGSPFSRSLPGRSLIRVVDPSLHSFSMPRVSTASRAARRLSAGNSASCSTALSRSTE